MSDMIVIPLPNGDELRAEVNPDKDYKEIFVYLKAKDGLEQDLAIVGADYVYPENGTKPNVVDDKFHVYVYGKEFDECYTESFEINKYKEE